MIKVQLDPESVRGFRTRVQDYIQEAGKTYADAMEQLAKACAKELAITVPPFGLSAKVGQQYQKSIAKQVNRAVSAGNVAGTPGDAEQLHKRYRNKRGQVPRNLKDRGQYQREPVSVRDKETYIDKAQERAGKAKGGWIAAAEKLNGKKITGVGRWVRRHAQKNGEAAIKIKGAGSEVILTNRVSYIDKLQRQDYVNTALKRGYMRNWRYMTILVKKLRKEI